jgi:hypothetical protein
MSSRRWGYGCAAVAAGMLLLSITEGQAQDRKGQTGQAPPIQPAAPRPLGPAATGQPRTGPMMGQPSGQPTPLRPDKDGVIRLPTHSLSAPNAVVNTLPSLGASAPAGTPGAKRTANTGAVVHPAPAAVATPPVQAGMPTNAPQAPGGLLVPHYLINPYLPTNMLATNWIQPPVAQVGATPRLALLGAFSPNTLAPTPVAPALLLAPPTVSASAPGYRTNNLTTLTLATIQSQPFTPADLSSKPLSYATALPNQPAQPFNNELLPYTVAPWNVQGAAAAAKQNYRYNNGLLFGGGLGAAGVGNLSRIPGIPKMGGIGGIGGIGKIGNIGGLGSLGGLGGLIR